MSRKQKIWLACVLLYVSIVIVIKWVQYEDPARVKQELVLKLDQYKAAQEFLSSELKGDVGDIFAYARNVGFFDTNQAVIPVKSEQTAASAYLKNLEQSGLICFEDDIVCTVSADGGVWFSVGMIASGLVLKDYYYHYIVYEPKSNLAGLPQNHPYKDKRTIYYKEPLDKHWTYVIEEELFD